MLLSLTAPATVTGTDSETGEAVSVLLPVGRKVWAERRIARPSIHGGGFEAEITDLDTGWTGKGRVA